MLNEVVVASICCLNGIYIFGWMQSEGDFVLMNLLCLFFSPAQLFRCERAPTVHACNRNTILEWASQIVTSPPPPPPRTRSPFHSSRKMEKNTMFLDNKKKSSLFIPQSFMVRDLTGLHWFRATLCEVQSRQWASDKFLFFLFFLIEFLRVNR